MNSKLLYKFYRNIMIQFPDEELYEAKNALDNKYNQEKIWSKICLINNSDCSNQSPKMVSNQAVYSHSIPRKNLRYMSTENEVYALKDDYKNPFKNNLKETNIKNALTFLGFCSYHDSQIFKVLENGKESDYDNEKIFLISYRTLAKNYSEIRESVERIEWEKKVWNSDEYKKYIKQLIIFDLKPYLHLGFNKFNCFKQFIIILLNILLHIRYQFVDKFKLKKELRFLKNQLFLNKKKLDEFNKLINSNNICNLYYKVFKNKKSIAFSLAINFTVNNKEVFVYMTAMPTENGSDIIVTCSESDYALIKTDNEMLKLFQGDRYQINRIFNMFKEKIVHNIDDYEMDFANKFFHEWSHPLHIIAYYEPMDN